MSFGDEEKIGKLTLHRPVESCSGGDDHDGLCIQPLPKDHVIHEVDFELCLRIQVVHLEIVAGAHRYDLRVRNWAHDTRINWNWESESSSVTNLNDGDTVLALLAHSDVIRGDRDILPDAITLGDLVLSDQLQTQSSDESVANGGLVVFFGMGATSQTLVNSLNPMGKAAEAIFSAISGCEIIQDWPFESFWGSPCPVCLMCMFPWFLFKVDRFS